MGNLASLGLVQRRDQLRPDGRAAGGEWLIRPRAALRTVRAPMKAPLARPDRYAVTPRTWARSRAHARARPHDAGQPRPGTGRRTRGSKNPPRRPLVRRRSRVRHRALCLLARRRHGLHPCRNPALRLRTDRRRCGPVADRHSATDSCQPSACARLLDRLPPTPTAALDTEIGGMVLYTSGSSAPKAVAKAGVSSSLKPARSRPLACQASACRLGKRRHEPHVRPALPRPLAA